jgi:ABC-type antimicrobial peptide transport system permease subunit
MGVYGILAYHVSQQTGEIGIRVALGAKPRNVLGRVIRHGSAIAGVGFLIGTPLAFLVVTMIKRIITDGSDGFVVQEGIRAGSILFPVAVLLGAGLVACLLPARKATRIDPAEALRTEG